MRAPAKTLLPIVVRVAAAPELVTVPAWPGFSFELRSSLIACERPLRSTTALRPSTRRDEAEIAPWMTVGYIGRSWGLDPVEIDTRAGLPLPVRGLMRLAAKVMTTTAHRI